MADPFMTIYPHQMSLFSYISSSALNPVRIWSFKPDKSIQKQKLLALLVFVVLSSSPDAYG